MKQHLRNIALNFLCSFMFLFIIGVLVLSSNWLASLSSSLAAFLLLFIYLSTVAGLILFYWLTTQYKIGLTILSFFVNLILFMTEQVVIEKNFHNSFLYQDENVGGAFVLVLGTFLWTFNKITLDVIFTLFRPKLQEIRFERYFRKGKFVL